MAELKKKASSFFDGYLYPIIAGALVFIAHTFSLEHIAILLLFGCACVSCIVCEDIRALLVPILYVTFSFSHNAYNNAFSSISFLIVVILGVSLFFGGLIAHIIIYKRAKEIKKLPSSMLFWGIIFLSGSFLLNGLFNFSEYKPINISFAFFMVFFLAFIFCFFYAFLKEREDTIEYLLHLFFIISLVIASQMIVLIVRDAGFLGESIDKNTLFLGWGAWNNIGSMLAMLLPVHFYYACVRKHGYIYLGTALFVFIAIVLTLSRSSLLFAGVVSAICVVIICIKGNNVKINRIITVCLAVVGIAGIIVIWDKISTLLASYLNQGLSDNGRFKIYKDGLLNFIHHPIFGGGFASCPDEGFGFGASPNKYHNTFIQLLGTCGIIGFGAYIFHRYQTIKLFIKQRSKLPVVFLALCILALLLTSLLDNHLFNLFPTMYYSVILAVIEKCQAKQE